MEDCRLCVILKATDHKLVGATALQVGLTHKNQFYEPDATMTAVISELAKDQVIYV